MCASVVEACCADVEAMDWKAFVPMAEARFLDVRETMGRREFLAIGEATDRRTCVSVAEACCLDLRGDGSARVFVDDLSLSLSRNAAEPHSTFS